jgi:hypothetical protein
MRYASIGKEILFQIFLEVASRVMQLDDVLICNRDLCLANLFVQNSARYGAGRTHIVDRNTLYFSLKHVS